jgi:hypothetical protein
MKRYLNAIFFVSIVVAAPRIVAAQSPGAVCKQGFVWREAFPGDFACVTPESRNQAARDNADPARAEPCRPGYVWREARASDHVCVPVPRRSAVAEENRLAPLRITGGPPVAPPPPGPSAPSGPHVLFTVNPTYNWAAGTMQFTSNFPSTGKIECGIEKSVEIPGGRTVPGQKVTTYFKDSQNKHRVLLSVKSLPKAKRYYFVVTVEANGTAEYNWGEFGAPQAVDSQP